MTLQLRDQLGGGNNVLLGHPSRVSSRARVKSYELGGLGGFGVCYIEYQECQVGGELLIGCARDCYCDFDVIALSTSMLISWCMCMCMCVCVCVCVSMLLM
jgi:hypothetical protein